jgi:glucose/arabinose dehydrogenase
METSVTEAKKKEQKPKTKKEEEDIAKAVQDNKDLKARFNADPKNKVILDQLNSVEKFLGLPLTKLVAENKWSSLKIASECKNGDHIGDIITVDGKYGIVKDRTADGKTTYLNEEDKLVTVDSTSITESTVDEKAAKVSVDKRYNNFSDAEILELEDRRFKEMFKKKIFYRGDNVIFKRDGKVYITIGDNSPVASVDLKGALTKAKVA